MKYTGNIDNEDPFVILAQEVLKEIGKTIEKKLDGHENIKVFAVTLNVIINLTAIVIHNNVDIEKRKEVIKVIVSGINKGLLEIDRKQIYEKHSD